MVLVPKNSPLRQVPVSVDRRTVLFLDGIRYSIQSFELASLRLARTLDHLAKTTDGSEDIGDSILEATSDAWAMVDSVHRLRELLQQVPRLKKKQPELQLFLRRTEHIEGLRHFFQHFRSEIDSFVERGMPLWGTISWVYGNPDTGFPENHTLVPGTYFEGAWVATCTFDTKQGKFVERVLLHAGSKRADLADLAGHVEQFVSWYVQWFQEMFPEKERLGADVHMRFRIEPVSDPESST